MHRLEGAVAKATAVIATTGLTYPTWAHKVFEKTSSAAVQLVPILSVLWLLVQIWIAVSKERARRRS